MKIIPALAIVALISTTAACGGSDPAGSAGTTAVAAPQATPSGQTGPTPTPTPSETPTPAPTATPTPEATPTPAPPAASSTPVSAAEWTALLKAAKPGSTIDLGTRRVTFARFGGLSNVTIKGGVFGFIILDNWTNVTFDGTRFEAAPEDRVMSGNIPPYVDAYSPVGLTVRNATFVGYTDSAGNLAPGSLRTRGGNNVVITRSSFHDLNNSLALVRTTNAQLTDNSFAYIREGVQVVGASNVVIARNTFGPFRPAPGDHPDGIQFFTTGLTNADDHGVRNALFEDNLFDPGEGYRAQGVFMGDELNLAAQGRGHSDITIRNNVMIGTGWHGITAGTAIPNLLIENNKLLIRLGADGVTDNWILVKNGSGIVRNNYAGSITLGPDVTASGNTSVKRAATASEITNAMTVLAQWVQAALASN